MTNNSTEPANTENTTMSETATETKSKGKSKGKAKAKAKNGAVKLDKLERLEPAPTRTVQETFRVTPDEHNELVDAAREEGFHSMSDFYRTKVGLDKSNGK